MEVIDGSINTKRRLAENSALKRIFGNQTTTITTNISKSTLIPSIAISTEDSTSPTHMIATGAARNLIKQKVPTPTYQ